MGYFPFFIDIKGKNVVIAGGGKVAYRKIVKLLPFEPEIKVISPEICEKIASLDGIETVQREFRDSDLDNAFAVIGATDDERLNSRISELCRGKNILVNIVDDMEKCGFIFPALVKESDITVGISTSGKSPLFAQHLRRYIDDLLDDRELAIAGILGRYRPVIKDMFGTEKRRKEAAEAILDLCLTGDELPDDEEINDMLGRIKRAEKIRIGTRKSKLALAQTNMVIERLHEFFPDIETEIVHISTMGDKLLDKPLSEIGGKGVFISEIEKALQSGEIDIAVHSAKDLPVKLGEGLEITGVLPRGSYGDVLVTPAGKELRESDEAIIGTGSLRRQMSFKKLCPNAVFRDIRGNVDTRLKKLLSGEYDGIILAKAGLERLGLYGAEQFAFTELGCDGFLPAPCQGIIAVEGRKNDVFTPIIQRISDVNTFYCFETERCVLQLLGGDCTMPVGAFADISENKIRLTVSKDCTNIISGEAEISRRSSLAEELRKKL